MTEKKTSLPLKIFFIVCFGVFIGLGSLYVGLLNGIKIDRLSLSNFEISQFYLKLDKKIVFEIDKLEIADDNTSGLFTPKINERTINLVQKILDKFQLIKIRYFSYNGFNGSFILDEKTIAVNSNKFDANITYANYQDKYDFIIHQVNVKDKQVVFQGSITNSLKTRDMNGSINVDYKNFHIPLTLVKKNDYLKIDLKSSVIIPSLKVVNDFTQLPNALNEWLFKRLSTGALSLKKFSIIYDTNEEKILLDKVYADVVVDKVILKFNDKITPVNAEKASVTIRNNRCDMQFVKPFLEQKNLQGSTASILELFTKPALDLNLRYADKIDGTIATVLATYGVTLPLVSQTQGITNATMNLFLPFDDRQMKIVANGTSINSIYEIEGKKIVIDSLNFLYDKNIQLSKTKLQYGDLNASIQNMLVRLDPKLITLDGNMSLPFIGKIGLNASANLDLKNFNAKVRVESFTYEKLLNVQNKLFNVYGDFNESVHIIIPEINFMMNKIKDKVVIEVPNINKLIQLSPIAQEYSFDEGSVKATTTNFSDIDFEANIELPLLPVALYHKEKEITKLILKGNKK